MRPDLTFVTVDGDTFGPFLTARSARSWLNEYEEAHLGAGGQIAVGRWRSRLGWRP